MGALALTNVLTTATRLARGLQLSLRNTTTHVVIHAKSTGRRIDCFRCKNAAAPHHPVAALKQEIAAVATNAGDVSRSATNPDSPAKGEYEMRQFSRSREL